ncbi:MAG TPA: iron-containing alcohol dehydrogenase, partial [Anaerolineaceae bacterium]
MPETLQKLGGSFPMDIYIGGDAVPHLLAYLEEHGYTRFTLVTDQNEYRAFGEKVETALTLQGWDVQTIILNGDPVTADDRTILQILAPLDNTPRIFLSVASGTITDMTRFVAYRTKSPFIAVPTAPSMDGYTSNGSSLTLDGLKQTVFSHPPVAVFADLDVLSRAPRPMVSAGLGDTFGKFTALADWKLGQILWDDPYSEEIAQRTRRSLMRCVELSSDLEGRWEENVAALTGALIDVGLCMLLTGSSRPASGSEHSLSHFWEMKLMRESRPVSFHG